MTIADVDLYRYKLPLTDPLQLRTSSVKHRRGLLVRLVSETGAVGWGEAAPLPNFSGETLPDVVAHAQSVLSRWIDTFIPPLEEGLGQSLQALPCGSDCPPSLQFAGESAVVALLAAANEASIPRVLGASRDTLDLNALITSPHMEGKKKAAWLREAGYRAVKVKVGHERVPKEAESIRAIHAELGEETTLRLDANRAWSLETALRFAEAIRGVDVAYIEEPLADPSHLAEFMTRSDLPVALDETTREVRPDVLHDDLPVTAVILKPTLLGGIQNTRRWVQRAQDNGIRSVMSSSYESGIGLRVLVAMAVAGPDTPVGLSTYDRLAADVLTPRLQMGGPVVPVRATTTPNFQINWTRLESVNNSF